MAYVLFISEERLKDSTTIGLNVDTSLLSPYLVKSQKLYIETRLGTNLTDKLKDLIKAGTVNNVGNEAYATLLNDYIAEVMPSYCLWMAVPFLRYKIEGGNIYSKTSETGTALSTEEAQQLRNEILNTGEYYMERMLSYICNNSNLFPEYSTNTGADVSPDRNTAFYSNMNLDRPIKSNRLTLGDFLSSGD
jgi:hypothetical protein|tara:strand:+ start:1876 stop:2448 length:573 start_codon:yes stop_codon:yes gene_type:complete